MVLLEISIQIRVIIGISAMVLLFSSFLVAFISNQRKKIKYHKELQNLYEQQQRALMQQNVLLEIGVSERTAELLQKKENLQTALTELKASQLQLIQKEKMASLGELTTGIAHEIQNPLNFVNNFAELNTELLTELIECIKTKNLPESVTENITPAITVLTGNMNKIMEHGKRADSIVKNMLQHSRSQTGQMELTNMNVLVKEYLNLAYNGFVTKNKLFNCAMQTSYDESIEMVNIIPQDIGRILINLFNNAFYSMKEKSKTNALLTKDEAYEPKLKVTTQKKADKTLLTIRDNGNGISPKFITKIYQPFFTTKPTGEGTGLGLSLSYDIIKAHQGELHVVSKEGEFAEFTIELNSLNGSNPKV